MTAAPDFTEPFRAFVEGRFQSEWFAQYPTIPMEFDNVPFVQPTGTGWVKFTFMQNPAKQVSIGRKKLLRTDGFLQIDVLERKEKGLTIARKMGEYAANIFAFQKFRSTPITATFDEKHVTEAPTATEFKRIMARVFFYYDGIADIENGIIVV